MSVKDIDKQYVANTYNRFPIEIVSGKGSVVMDDSGKEYIDMGSGIGVTSFGLCDDVWLKAVVEQASKLQHMSNLYYTEPCALLAKMLCEKTGMKKVFFSNSGAEANECAIKAARKYSQQKKGREYSTVVTLENSFHGRTLTTLAATGQEHYHELFTPLTPGFVHTKANDFEALKAVCGQNKTAGIMLECIQGEGGVVALDADIVTTAKGLAGGLPLGAALLGEKVEGVLGFGDHGSTFGGNPISCNAALSILERIDEKLLNEVKEKGKYIFNELENAPGAESVSGMGLMIGIKTVKPVSEVVEKCIENGVLCLTAKDKLRLLPALNIKMSDLEKAVGVIKEALI